MAAVMITNENYIEEAPLFKSAEQAVRFAMSREGMPRRPASARMLDAVSGGRRSFSSLDKAAQAGMILNVIESAGRLELAIMTAASAPRSYDCTCRRPCCSGKFHNLEWARAINVIADAALLRAPSNATRSVRLACVMKLFGAGDKSFNKIAEAIDADPEVVSKHYKAIQRWLRGQKAGRDRPCEPGIESMVWRNAESSLRSAGIVG